MGRTQSVLFLCWQWRENLYAPLRYLGFFLSWYHFWYSSWFPITSCFCTTHGKWPKEENTLILIQNNLKIVKWLWCYWGMGQKVSSFQLSPYAEIGFHSILHFRLWFSLAKYELVNLPSKKGFIVIISGSNSYFWYTQSLYQYQYRNALLISF